MFGSVHVRVCRYVEADGRIGHVKIKHIKDMGFAVKLLGKTDYDLFPTLSHVLLACNLFLFFYPNLPKKQTLESLTTGDV
jgi:hypothetical protein